MKLDYSSGYLYGQHDALTWLTEPRCEKDHPLAAFEERMHLRASLVCLARNLAIGAALCRAHEIGRLYGDDEDARYRGWAPGRGRNAP
jgi:hypothetical protein